MKSTRTRAGGPERARRLRLWVVIVAALALWLGMTWSLARAQAQALDAAGGAAHMNDSAAGAQAHAVAATLIVTNTNESGAGSLRDRLGAANPGDTIQFNLPANSVIANTLNQLQVTKTVNIDGSTATNLTLSGNTVLRVMTVYAGASVTLKSLTIANGFCPGCDGGAILNYGTLTISNSIVSGSNATNDHNAQYGLGGAIYNFGGTLSIISTTVRSNVAGSGGAGIYNAGGALVIAHSTFTGNSASTGNGGGIYNSGALTVTDSTFSSNQLAQGGYYGGGIYNSGTLAVTNSTFGSNTAYGGGGGAIANSGILTVTNSTVSGNIAESGYGGGIYNSGAASLRNTVLANNSGNDCGGSPLTADAYNLADDNHCGGATQKTAAQINLGPLADNGGSTQTFALLPGSAALDAGNDAVCPATDQRGSPRPLGAHCDAGAFEFVLTVVNDSPTHLGSPTTFTATTPLTPLTSLTWNFGDGSATGIGNPKAHTYAAPGDYTAIVTATSGQGVFTATTAVIICGGTTVLNTNDNGAGSLRRAVLCALPNATLTFSPTLAGQTILLTTGEIAINKAMTIEGSNALGIKLNGNGASRVFNVSAPATLNDLIFQNANCAVYICVGGAVYNSSTLVVSNSTFSGNSALPNGSGAGIGNDGTLSVTNSTFDDNSAHYYGGGINNTGILSVTNSTFKSNHAGNYGGGIYNSGSVSVTNSTLSGNEGDTQGSGIYNAGTATLRNTIIDNPLVAPNCNNTVTADAHNLSDDASCGSATQKTSGQINLGGLADNGGRTNTMALLPGSAAIDAGDDTVCPPTDQRGITRPQAAHCDVGAFEAVPVPPAAVAISGPAAGPINTSLAYTATVSPLTATQPITYVWQATGQSALTHTLSAASDSVNFQWNSAGPQSITVTARNTVGVVQSSHVVTLSVPPAAVVITGPVSGLVNSSMIFTASVSPLTVTQPITYVWQATGQSTLTHTLSAINDAVNYQWSSGGPQAITVTARNAFGVVQSSHVVTISVPPAAVAITGPSSGVLNTSLLYTATVSPLTATQPITYVWQATGQATLTHTLSALNDSVNFQWGIAGTQWITVTARNTGGVAQSSYSVTIGIPPAAVVIAGPTFGLVNTSLGYTATVSPPTATEPITYVWQATGQSTLTHTLSAINDSVNFQWSSAGPKSITVTARSAAGVVQANYSVTISNPLPTLTAISPIKALAGGPAFTLTVTGTNFVPGSVVRWNGVARTTTFIGSGELQAAIPAADIVARSTVTITVFNPPTGGGESGPLNFAIWGAVYLPAIIR